LPLAAAWKAHFQRVNMPRMSLDETVSASPAPGKAPRVVSGGMTCGPMTDVTYYIVPEDLPEGCFLHAVGDENAETTAEPGNQPN
jgi:hypothetical protein